MFDNRWDVTKTCVMHIEKITLAIITLNEEKNIERCIASVPFASEVVVLDSGSQDKTAELAKRAGAKVFVEAWRGYSAQKTRAMELAAHDWVLSLDADEALSPELAQELKSLLQAPLVSGVAYAMPRKTWYLGRWMNHSGMYPDLQTRLFHRREVHWKNTHVHEHIVAKSTTRLKGDILHWPVAGLNQHIDTINRYSSLRALDFYSRGRRYSGLKMLVKVMTGFLRIYILKRGFLDGRPGLINAFVSSFSAGLRIAKLYEQELSQNDSRPN